MSNRMKLYLVTGNSIGAIVLSLIALAIALPTFNQYINTDPTKDGYVEPRNIAELVSTAQASTVTIHCDLDENTGWFGSAWATDLDLKLEPGYKTALFTNYHVIEDCLNDDGTLIEGSLTIQELGSDTSWDVIVYNYDYENDLALLETTATLTPLTMSDSKPYPGYWVMAVGTAAGYEGSIAFGNVLNFDVSEILITANISHGNSGGPLIDNLGNVVGINTYSAINEQYNGAMSLDAMCAVIIECDGDTYWKD